MAKCAPAIPTFNFAKTANKIHFRFSSRVGRTPNIIFNNFTPAIHKYQRRDLKIIEELIRENDDKGKILKRDFRRGMGFSELNQSLQGYKPVPTQPIVPQNLPKLPRDGWKKLENLNKENINFFDTLKANPDKFVLLIISDRRVITGSFIDQWKQKIEQSTRNILFRELVLFEELLFRLSLPLLRYLIKKTLKNKEDSSNVYLFSDHNLEEFKNEMLCLNPYLPYVYLIDSKARVHLVSSGAPKDEDIVEINKVVNSSLDLSSLSKFD